MTWVDWAIVMVMVLSVLGGLSQGFFRSSARWAACCWAWRWRPGITPARGAADALVRIERWPM
jgi:hypothetical protein